MNRWHIGTIVLVLIGLFFAVIKLAFEHITRGPE